MPTTHSSPETFPYDVFLSDSAKDKAVVRDVAERLRKDGVKVWFDEWVLKPGDPVQKKIDDGLEESRVLVLCMSAHAFGSDWAQLEAGTFRFRDPLNQERRFIPLRLDDAPIKGSLAQFLFINWHPTNREQEYAKLLQGCRNPTDWPPAPNPKGANSGHSTALVATERKKWSSRLSSSLKPAFITLGCLTLLAAAILWHSFPIRTDSIAGMEQLRRQAAEQLEAPEWYNRLPPVLEAWRQEAAKLDDKLLGERLLQRITSMEEKCSILAKPAVRALLDSAAEDLRDTSRHHRASQPP